MTLPRKYIKWIRKQTGLHPSFEPSRRVDVGDYGYIDPKTGQFLSEGNVFDLREDGKSIAELLGVEVVETGGNIFHKFTSRNASVVEVIPEAHLGGPATSISAGFEVSFRKGGAVALIFLHGTLRSIRHEGRLRDSIFDRIFGNTKSVVTRLWTAPTYIFCISDKHEQTFTINLQASIPSLSAVAPSGGFSTSFRLNSSSDYLQVGPPITPDLVGNPQALTRFYPVFVLANTTKIAKAWLPINDQNLTYDCVCDFPVRLDMCGAGSPIVTAAPRSRKCVDSNEVKITKRQHISLPVISETSLQPRKELRSKAELRRAANIEKTDVLFRSFLGFPAFESIMDDWTANLSPTDQWTTLGTLSPYSWEDEVSDDDPSRYDFPFNAFTSDLDADDKSEFYPVSLISDHLDSNQVKSTSLPTLGVVDDTIQPETGILPSPSLELSKEILTNNQPSEDGAAYSTVENEQSLLTFVETGNEEPDTSLDNRLVSEYLDPRMEVLKQLKISLALYQAVVD